jgi:DNA-3-methyladenine glycosylase II
MTDEFKESLRAAEVHLAQADAALGTFIASHGPCTIEKSGRFQPFHALLNSIAHQQLNGTAAQTIMRRVRERFAKGRWPSAQTMAKARLPAMRACGLSRAKALAFRDLAHKTLDGTVPSARSLHAMSDQTIIERLTQVRGIGQWTVEMMLMFRLGRLDVLPVDDFGVRKGFTKFARLDELVSKKALTAYAEQWRPYRSIGSWYMWRVVDAG